MIQEEEDKALAEGNFEEVVVEEFECKVCKKKFKNEKQLHNHLQSKKHKDNYAKFKVYMELDEETEKKNLEIQKQKEEELKKEQEKLKEQ